MLQTIAFSFYLALGAAVFAAIEGWSFTDGLYWADYTVLTIGLGTDFPLKTTLGRMLLIPYAPFGIAMVGLLVNSVMGLVMERAKEKVVKRHLGKERDRWTDHISKKLQGEDERKGLKLIAPRPRSLLCCWHYKEDKKVQQLPGVIANASLRSTHRQDIHAMWHHAEFELMRYIQFTSEKSERYFALVVSFIAFLIVWIGASLVFWATEHVSRAPLIHSNLPPSNR
jgi:potassium channel subfamily K